ncbi:MAG: hypothetical protein INR68_02815 [Methylobacterium mesophilicum]|nr:hypothetical protein [Methylobacterium mesophilicum]
MSVSIAREQGAFVRRPAATPQQAGGTAASPVPARETPSPAASALAPSRGTAELSQALAAFLSQYNDNSSGGATASARHVAEAYGAASDTFEPAEVSPASAAPSPEAIDGALNDLQAGFDSLIYNLRSVNAQQADPSRPMASSYTMPGAKNADAVTQMKADVADFVGGLMKVTLAIGQNGAAAPEAAAAALPAMAQAAVPAQLSSPSVPQPKVETAAGTVAKAPQATVLYTPQAAAPVAAPQVFSGINPNDQRSSLFGRLQRHFQEL